MKTVLIFIYIQVLFISGFSDTLVDKTTRPCEYEQFICDDSIKYVFDEGILFGVFTKEDGPFLISNSITVPSGETLEFGPGCKIYIAGNNPSITVFGKIQIKGNAQSPVVFMSGKKNAAAGDWDRIYCRSNERSIFDYCIIRNSNYGIYVENGSAIIQNCIFEHNKVHALAVKNAETTVSHSKFSGGHNVAISLYPGALVEATNLILFENQTAIGSHDLSILRLDSGSISKNINGIVTTQNASIKIVAASITRNKNGVLSTANIPRRMRDMIYGNGTDAEVISADEMGNILLKPEDFKTFGQNQKNPKLNSKQNFTPGFSAVNISQEKSTDFVGNVTTGFQFFSPKSKTHPIDDTLVTQTRYPEYIQPEIQFFGAGRKGGADINLLLDIYGNKWLAPEGYIGKNIVNLSFNFAEQLLQFGDFFENGSNLSISGRQITGLKYSGNFLNMGAGMKRFEFKLAAGETEISKDFGDHELNIYNDIVDSGMSVRQQITYISALAFKPTRNSSISTKGIIARDQVDRPLFRSPVSDPGAPDPVEAQSGSIEANIDLLDENLSFFGEINIGNHDTLSKSEMKKIAWYNPNIDEAIPNVFSLLNHKKFNDHYAASLGARATLGGYKLELTGTQVATDYFSAGNPYIESDMRSVALSAKKEFNDKISATALYNYGKTSRSDNPSTVNSLDLHGELATGENKPSFSLDYSTYYEYFKGTERVVSNDSSFSGSYFDRSYSNLIVIEGKQSFINGISYSLRYQFLFDNDVSNHLDPQLQDEGDRYQNTLQGSVAFRIKKIVKNKLNIRVSNKIENRDSLQGYYYKIGDQLTLNVIPRKLKLIIGGDYSNKKETEFSNEYLRWLTPIRTISYGSELEIKYSITSKISFAFKGRYEKGYDEVSGSAENYTAVISGLHLTYLF